MNWTKLSNQVKVKVSYVTTDGQSASLSWRQAPIWDLRPDFFFCVTVAGLLMWGSLSDEGTGLSFTMCNVQYIYILHAMTRMYIQYTGSEQQIMPYLLCAPVISSRRTEYRSPSQTFPLLLSVFPLLRNVPNDLLPSNGLVFPQAYPLSWISVLASRCLAVDYSGFQASCHSIL
jgi:hypothetical protein